MLTITNGRDTFRLGGRCEELVALIVVHRAGIEAMTAGSLAYHFGQGPGGSLWLHDRLTVAADARLVRAIDDENGLGGHSTRAPGPDVGDEDPPAAHATRV